jgi:hypothetical protein
LKGLITAIMYFMGKSFSCSRLANQVTCQIVVII